MARDFVNHLRTALVSAAMFVGLSLGLMGGYLFYAEFGELNRQVLDSAARSVLSVEVIAGEKQDAPVATSSTSSPSLPATSTKADGITLVFFGDMMFDRTVAARIKAAKSLDYPFARISGSRLLDEDHVVVANLEGPLTAKRRAPVKDIDFAIDPNMAFALKRVGIDAVSQANNHALDQGRQGAEESRAVAEAAGLAVFGDQAADDGSASSAFMEKDGMKIALLGFNTSDNPLDKEAALASLQAAREQADRVVVFMHWGREYAARPDKAQIELAHWLADQGADAVIGAHPHWVQSIEVYGGKPVVYSLGNFIFDQDWSPETGYGMAVELNLNASVGEFELHPLKIVKSQAMLLAGQERQDRLDRLAEISDKALSGQIRSGRIVLNRPGGRE